MIIMVWRLGVSWNDKVDHVAFAKQYAENGSPSGR